MPVLLPISTPILLKERYKEAKDIHELWLMLKKTPLDLINFFEGMCEDENWCLEQPKFTGLILDWLTEKLYQNKLLHALVEKPGKLLQQHITVLQPFLTLNITFEIEGNEIKENSFLLGANSHFFQEIIVREFRDLKKEIYSLPNVTLAQYQVIKEFITTGEVKELWKLSSVDSVEILKKAIEWELNELATLCENNLIKYINRDNVFDILLQSDQLGWKTLKKTTYHFINEWNGGIRFVDGEGITVEFVNFKERALELFLKVRLQVTRLIIGGTLPDAPEFSWVMKNTPNLIGLDLSHSSEFTNRLQEIPVNLQELDISMCSWLKNEQLKWMIAFCPNVQTLKIRSNGQLNLNGWGYLQKLTKLVFLDISFSDQIFDEEMKMIIKACPKLTTLLCEDCKKIGERGFYEIAFGLPYLNTLHVARNEIADPSLIEIGHRCRFLKNLVITRCLNITDKGVLEVVRHCLSLQFFNFVQCPIHTEIMHEIKRIKPNLTTVS